MGPELDDGNICRKAMHYVYAYILWILMDLVAKLSFAL